jgi:2-polyprenyl-6-methoxyphenol hydroxylase-like FAD-dependent oxidoreductase
MNVLGNRAVVLGAGFAGLLSARVLAEHYECVTVIERDALVDSLTPRKGVPQGRHLHSLLPRGSQILEDLFPELLNDLVADGVHVVDDGDLSRLHTRMGPYELNRTGKFADPAAVRQPLPSRPVLEHHLRRRVRAQPNIDIRDNHDVLKLMSTAPHRVTGVRIANRATAAQHTLNAELVVDATGRASRAPALLTHLGYGAPPQHVSTAHGTYYSQRLAVPAGAIPEKLVLIVPNDGSPAGGLVAAENDTYILTITGLGGSAPPSHVGDMIALAEKFAPATTIPGLRAARSCGEIATYRYQRGIWHRYDKMPDFPTGLLVFGDALCTLNPLRGQGMTMTALQTLALRDVLRSGDTDLGPRFYAAAAKQIAPIWFTNESLEPDTGAGHRASLSRSLTGWFTKTALRAASTDIVLTERFFRVGALIDPPQRLQDPAVIARVLLSPILRRLGRVR